jgi:hypothetical protein
MICIEKHLGFYLVYSKWKEWDDVDKLDDYFNSLRKESPYKELKADAFVLLLFKRVFHEKLMIRKMRYSFSKSKYYWGREHFIHLKIDADGKVRLADDQEKEE